MFTYGIHGFGRCSNGFYMASLNFISLIIRRLTSRRALLFSRLTNSKKALLFIWCEFLWKGLIVPFIKCDDETTVIKHKERYSLTGVSCAIQSKLVLRRLGMSHSKHCLHYVGFHSRVSQWWTIWSQFWVWLNSRCNWLLFYGVKRLLHNLNKFQKHREIAIQYRLSSLRLPLPYSCFFSGLTR